MSSAVLSPKARNDLVESIRWIAKDNPTAALALRGAVQKVALMLGNHQNSGRERLDIASPPIRFLALSGFPYIIVYDAASNPPLVLRVLHGARDLPELFDNL
jgi:toxin ParE1/3/4